ncbi:KpsF/GutQ family sugar-phosphate isomerase [Sphingomonas sp. UYP23]
MKAIAATSSQHPGLLSALRTTRIQMVALQALSQALNEPPLRDSFLQAVDTIAANTGRLVVTGMGKSGIVARKIAATMRSTGTPSLFLHPSEASHGDLGMISREDIVFAISWSGETTELGDIIAYCRRFGVRLIVATAHPDSTAARAADICLSLPHVREACPNELAPTSSTTVQVVLGDALAVALIERRGFTSSDFLAFHPGGRLGARLATTAQLMAKGEDIPVVKVGASLIEATIEMSRKRCGCTAVVDEDGRLLGVFTDGDLRRAVSGDHMKADIRDHMTLKPITVGPELLASDALRLLNEKAVSVLFVVSGEKLVGLLHLHEILRAGVA